MKKPYDILVFVAAMAGSLAVALITTWIVWELWIPERAFHCTDDGLSIAFWQNAETHRTAGDKILPGWTWEKLGVVNRVYEAAFFALWIGGGVLAFHASRSVLRDYV